MAECVSCGRQIATGTFFCDECYKSMKGKLGPSNETASDAKRATGPAVGDWE